MLATLLKSKSSHNSKLSDFVLSANSSEKKRVYSHVIDKAIASQNQVTHQSNRTNK